MGHVGVGWGGSCRGEVGHVGVRWSCRVGWVIKWCVGSCMSWVGLETLFDLYDPPHPPLSHLWCNVMSCDIINMMRLHPLKIPRPLFCGSPSYVFCNIQNIFFVAPIIAPFGKGLFH